MIIGKPLTALGGGGLTPEIIVTAKAGVLLNLHYKDSSIMLQSYQLGANETTHTFVVNVSETAYVVEDITNGESVEVLVDAITQYSIAIQYKTFVYKDGTFVQNCTLVSSGSGMSMSNQDGYMLAVVDFNGYNSKGVCGYRTSNQIDVTEYKKLCIQLDVISASSNGDPYSHFSCMLTSKATPSYGDMGSVADIGIGTVSESLPHYYDLEKDISSISGSYYVFFGLQCYTYNAHETHKIYRIWLE